MWEFNVAVTHVPLARRFDSVRSHFLKARCSTRRSVKPLALDDGSLNRWDHIQYSNGIHVYL